MLWKVAQVGWSYEFSEVSREDAWGGESAHKAKKPHDIRVVKTRSNGNVLRICAQLA